MVQIDRLPSIAWDGYLVTGPDKSIDSYASGCRRRRLAFFVSFLVNEPEYTIGSREPGWCSAAPRSGVRGVRGARGLRRLYGGPPISQPSAAHVQAVGVAEGSLGGTSVLAGVHPQDKLFRAYFVQTLSDTSATRKLKQCRRLEHCFSSVGPYVDDLGAQFVVIFVWPTRPR